LHPIGKLIIGVIMIVGSAAAILNYPTLWQSLKTVVLGVVPAAVLLLGIFIVWLELDELKIEKELKKETKKKK